MESNNTLKNEQLNEECEESLKGPSFTFMYVLLVALFSFIFISMFSLNQLKQIEKEKANQITEIKNALANLEKLPDQLYTAEGEKKNLTITIEHPKISMDQEDYLGTIIPIIQEENAQAYDKLSSNLTLFSIVIALFSLALPIFSYTFIQRDQLRNINAQHYRLKKDALLKFKELEDNNNDLKKSIMKTVNEEIEKLRKEINQTQQVTSSVIPNPNGNDAVEITPTSESPADTARALFLGAKINLNIKKYEEALKQIDQAIELEPNNAEYHYIRSVVLWNKANYEDALSSANTFLQLEPNNAKYYNSRGVTLHDLTRYDDALNDKTKAIELEPNNAEYYSSRGATLHKLKRFKDALYDENKAIELEPNNARYYYNRGVTFQWLNRHEDALKDENKAIELKPNNASYYNCRATVYWRLKHNEDARKDIERAMLIEPNNRTYQAYFAYSHYKVKDYDQALDHCTKLGNDVDSLYLALRARAMSTLKQSLLTGNLISKEEREIVLNDLDKAVKINPENHYTLLDQAQVFFLLQEYVSLRESLEKALDIDPDEPETYHWLAEYYRAIGDVDNAALNDRLADEKGYIPEPEE